MFLITRSRTNHQQFQLFITLRAQSAARTVNSQKLGELWGFYQKNWSQDSEILVKQNKKKDSWVYCWIESSFRWLHLCQSRIFTLNFIWLFSFCLFTCETNSGKPMATSDFERITNWNRGREPHCDGLLFEIRREFDPLILTCGSLRRFEWVA